MTAIHDVRIARATYQERLNIIRRLDKEIFPDDRRIGLHDLNTVFWLAWVGDEPAAFAAALLIPDINYVYLKRAGVMPAFRGRGIHDALLNARIRWARRKGAEALITYTATHNAASSNNLIDHKFRIYSPENPWAGEEFIYWIRYV